MAVRREQVIRTAEKYVSKGRIDAAIKEYRKVLDRQPEDVNTLNRLGDLYARIERYDEAVKLFEQIAEGYTDDGFFVKAIAIYKKIIKLDPTRLEIYERLAELYHKQGLINEARTQYQVLADYYAKHNNPTSAVKVYHEMAELEPENPSHHAKLAELYVGLRLTDKAMREYATIAELMIDHGHPEDAVQVYRKALDVNDSDLDFITEAATRLKESGHVAEAARFLSLAVDRNPEARTVAQEVGMERQPQPEPEPPPESKVEDAAPAASPEAAVEEVELEAATELETDDLETEAEPQIAAGEVEEGEEDDQGDVEDDVSVELVLDLDDADSGLDAAMEEAAEAVQGPDTQPLAPAGDTADGDTAAADSSMLEAEALDADALGVGALDTEALEVDLPEPVAPEVETREAGSPAGSAEPAEAEDLGEAFVLDLEDEEDSPSLVRPPEDMMDGRPARAFLREEPQEEEPREGERREEEAREEAAPPDTAETAEAAEVAATESLAPGALGDADQVAFDPEVLERTVSDLQPPAETERDDSELVSEAEVLAKYGMIDKALERLRDAISLNPENLEAYEVMLNLHLDEGEDEAVRRMAPRMAKTAEEVGDTERWPKMRERLERAGFQFEESAPEQPPKPPARPKKKAKSEARVERLLDDLVGGYAPKRKRKKAPPAEEPAAPEPPASEPPASEPPIPEAAAPEAPPETEAETGQEIPESLRTLEEDDIHLSGIFDEVEVADTPMRPSGAPADASEAAAPESKAPASSPAETPPAEAVAPEATPSSEVDDSGTSWLDEVEAETASGDPDADLFEGEDDFFDLAGELEEELSREEAMDGSGLIQSQEQSLEEIVEGFKQGVSENLSPEDHDTHFNLGIAYREMGLLDEAIGEFQVAAKSRRHLVECCSMLGLCFLEKGLPELAVKWYRQGLETSDLTEEETLGLLYDMGNVYLDLDDREAAQKTFVELYGINSNYRDVVAKLEELKKA